MKRKYNLILLSLACLLIISCDSGQEKVTLSKGEVETAVSNKDEMAGTLLEERKDLFRILLLMNEVERRHAGAPTDRSSQLLHNVKVGLGLNF